jgi:predicted lipoprotein with Yx(FWY)xxD motif
MTRRTRRSLVTIVCVVVGVALVLPTLLASSKAGPTQTSEVSVLHSSRYGSVLVVGRGELKDFPLYEFSGDHGKKFGCGTTLAKGFDGDHAASVPLTCTGPMRDMLNDSATDDWPAFTSSGPPIAGKGVNRKLLGTVHRPGIGNQVTYGGHPLYLFDPSSGPFSPQGEGYVETVTPLAPWHGYWWLVSSHNGEPAPGVATLEVGTLPSGKQVLAAKEDENIFPLAVTVYALSSDRPGTSTCTSACSVSWVPLLSSQIPHVAGGIRASDVGVIDRVNGTGQVTYEGRPLYLYSREEAFLTKAGLLKSSGTAGNGDGAAGPAGSTFTVVEPRS